jgi:Ca2+-binding RTX toxin-like protein
MHISNRASVRRLAVGTAGILTFGSLAATGGMALPHGGAYAGANAVSVSSGQMTFVGGPESNNVTVTNGAVTGERVVIDTGHDLTAGAGCSRIGWGQARCHGVTSTVFIRAGGGNDIVQSGGDRDIIDGEAGNDTLRGGAAGDDLRGGPGADRLFGEAGNDKLSGGKADSAGSWDEGLDGNDTLSGGGGQDWVTYLMKGSATRLTLDGVANDGIAGLEQDNLALDIEDVTGTQYNDSITGSSITNRLFGTWGADRIYGRAGNDFLYGEKGADRVWGEDGNDTLFMRHATPTAPDFDVVASCGLGADVLRRDAADPDPTGCETILFS